MKVLFILIFIGSSLFAESQVNIIKDSRLDNLILLRKNRKYFGYRVQIGFSTDKKEIETIRKLFLDEFPDIETKMTFEAPYFNLKVGNFRTKIEAEFLIDQITYSFPLANLQKEEIDLPSIN